MVIENLSKKKVKIEDKTTSGFQNRNLINQIEGSIGVLSNLMGKTDDKDLLYKVLLGAMQNNEDQSKRVEPTGVHFIDQGEVLVVGKNKVPQCRLGKCDSFGMYDIHRKPVSQRYSNSPFFVLAWTA